MKNALPTLIWLIVLFGVSSAVVFAHDDGVKFFFGFLAILSIVALAQEASSYSKRLNK